MSTNRTTAESLDYRLNTLLVNGVIEGWNGTPGHQWNVTVDGNTEAYGFAEIKAFVDGAAAMNGRYQMALEGVMEGLA